MNYRLAYSIGFHPWEDAAAEPEFVKTISELFEREERESNPPHGKALDLGTGSGIWGIQLAERGWQVTGIDLQAKALQRAQDRVREADVNMRLVQGDVTSMNVDDVGHGFQLVLDTGTFHDFDREKQRAMGRAVSAVAAAEATVLLLVWPKRIRPLIRGATRGEIEDAFPGWTITHVEPSYFRLPKPLELLLRPDEKWYRLRRSQDS
jgi:SAM-dependent methyltransferase